LNEEQITVTIGKQIQNLRKKAGMTQEKLASELNVTQQALSNWERDINEPDLNTLKKICFLFGVHINDFAKEVMNMEVEEKEVTDTKIEKRQKREFNQYDMAIGLFYAVGLFLGIGIFFVGGFITMSDMGWTVSLFGGACFFIVFGLLCHAVITLKRNDKK